jgi:hypothetical protein
MRKLDNLINAPMFSIQGFKHHLWSEEMSNQAKNVSSGDQNIEIKLDSKYMVLIDSAGFGWLIQDIF